MPASIEGEASERRPAKGYAADIARLLLQPFRAISPPPSFRRPLTKIHTLPTQRPSPNADERFVDYYARESASGETRLRLESTRRVVLGLRARSGLPIDGLEVVDVGCGAGAQALLWAASGHRVHGIDISAPLIDLARQRSSEAGLVASFAVSGAERLPMPDGSADIVLISELLEHVADWQPCVNEAVRVLRPGGVLYLSTTNRLCPVQQEFDLPAYSWYPRRLKQRCEKMAVTTHGHWVQFASFPAVHWFSFYQLRDYLRAFGMVSHDRFDLMDTGGSPLRSVAASALRMIAPLRYVGHVLTPYTVVAALRPI